MCQLSIGRFALLTRFQILARFKKYGGVLRSLFRESSDTALDCDYKSAASTVGLNPDYLPGVMNLYTLYHTTPEIPHMIASFVVGPDYRSKRRMWLSPEIAANVFRAVRSRDLHNGMLVLHMILQLGEAGRTFLGKMYQPLVKRVLEKDGGWFDCYKINEMAGGKDLKYVVDANNKTKMTFKPLSDAIDFIKDAFNKIVEHNESPKIKVR